MCVLQSSVRRGKCVLLVVVEIGTIQVSLPSKVRTLEDFVLQVKEPFDKVPSSFLVLPQ